MTNLVQFPGLGLSFQLNRVAFTIGGVSIYWYGVCIAVGLCLALVFAFRHSLEFGVDPDSKRCCVRRALSRAPLIVEYSFYH